MLTYTCPDTGGRVRTNIDTSDDVLQRLRRFRLSLSVWCPHCQAGHQLPATDAAISDDQTSPPILDAEHAPQSVALRELPQQRDQRINGTPRDLEVVHTNAPDAVKVASLSEVCKPAPRPADALLEWASGATSVLDDGNDTHVECPPETVAIENNGALDPIVDAEKVLLDAIEEALASEAAFETIDLLSAHGVSARPKR